jgi:phenylalanyl-tRNA synthetase beta subunit
MEHQTAMIISQNQEVGVAGKIDPVFLNKLDLHTECDAFFFELDADYLISAPSVTKRYKPISKYQDSYFDLSLAVPLELEAQKIKDTLNKSNSFITKIDLLDFFEKPEWQSFRSITFRVWVNSSEKTLDKDEIETIRTQTISSIEVFGAKLRF